MQGSTRDFFLALQGVLLRCWVLGFVLMLITVGAATGLRGAIDNVHGSMFDLSKDELDLFLYQSLAFLKLLILTLFFIPWLAVKLTLGRSPQA